jgi:hypothetical protein
MDRRTFVGASLATLCSAAGSAADQRPEAPELYELRTYALKPANQPRLDESSSPPRSSAPRCRT